LCGCQVRDNFEAILSEASKGVHRQARMSNKKVDPMSNLDQYTVTN
jgi:hypothetical protein